MRKRQLIAALKQIGLSVLDQNGLLIIESRAGIVMYLQSRIFYTKPWLYLYCFLHRDLFDQRGWKTAYRSITSANQQLKIMEQKFINEEVRSYLSAYYTLSYRKCNKDHYYNYRNRQTMAMPLPEDKPLFSEQEVVAVFGGKAEHKDFIEVVRFKNFQTSKINNYE